MEEIEFLKNAILGRNVGAISRSSKFVIKSVLKNLKGKNFSQIVEYGPGDGVLTVELLKLLDKDGRILLVETDKNFIKILQKIKDKRIVIVNKKMEEVSPSLVKFGFNSPDLIISSIPFSLIPKEDREVFVKNSFNALREEGKFIIFHQYSQLMKKIMSKYFKKVKVDFEPRNVFPCFIFVSQK